MIPERWMRSTLKDIRRYYDPRYHDVVRMDTSVNVLGPNPVVKKVLDECEDVDVNQYPKPYSDALRATGPTRSWTSYSSHSWNGGK